MHAPNAKYEKLLSSLRKIDGAAVAFSGGVDSSFLLHAAREAFGDRLIAVTISAPYTPQWEMLEAKEITHAMQVRQYVVELPFPEEIRNNPADHCYTCKSKIFSKILEVSAAHGFNYVLDGTNTNDLSDYRPGLKALRELGITSPLVDAGLDKNEIRQLSRKAGLSTWDKPSYACLLSRLPADCVVHEDDLRRIEQAEVFLMSIGFRAVRVRHHGEVARIEVPENRVGELIKANKKHDIESRLKKLGYRHVSVDISGYSMGSLNKINPEPKTN